MYAVIDLETTGLNVGMRHRICEIAIIGVDSSGRIRDEWCSLVNPERDLGPQAVHGITAADARRAPSFANLACHVADRLRGRIVVAHNLAFDAGFLRAEFARMGHDVPVAYADGLCTMRLAADFLPYAGRSLADCCLAAGIDIEHAHSALYDARAAAKLLGTYVAQAGPAAPWNGLAQVAANAGWPDLPYQSVMPARRRETLTPSEHFLARMVERLPRVPEPPQADQYLQLLDTVLVDRNISETEAEALVDLAEQQGLSRAEVVALHGRYLQALAVEACDDGVVTDAEFTELVLAAELLGLSRSDASAALDAAREPAPEAAVPILPGQRFRLQAGDHVAFTGQMGERELWEERAREFGLAVGGTVTRQSRLLVAADPDTLSGKARQARRYLVPIVRLSDFQRKLAEIAPAEPAAT
jgi:DNA polymerase-3 subunit epsilon